MARLSPPANPTISVFSWSDNDEDTVTDYTGLQHGIQNSGQEYHSSASSRSASQRTSSSSSSSSSSDSRETSPETTLNPKTSSRKSLPTKFSSTDSSKSSVNSLPKMTLGLNIDNVSPDAEVFLTRVDENEESLNFERNTIATASIRSNSCPSYETAYRVQKRSSTLKAFQSDNTFMKRNKPRLCSQTSLTSLKFMLTSHDKDISVSGSLENVEQLLPPSIPPEDIQNFLTDEHTINQKIRQGDLYEIIQTERNHCTALAEVKKLFGGKSYRAILGDEVGVFEHIDKIFSVHYSFHGSLRKMQGDGVYIEHVGSLIHHFLTCVKQLDLDKSYGLVSYYCTRAVKELPSRTPVQITGVPLRLTKFQIQLDSLLKHSKDESEREKQLVAKSLAMVKEVLCSINEIIDCKEKEALLKTLHRKIDSKSCLFLKGVKFTKHDLKNRKLIHHAQVKINITQQKVHSVVLLLFDDVLVFLQRTSSSKYQFYQTHTDKKLIKLHSWIMREKAGTKTSIYLFSSNPDTAMLEVMTDSGSARALLIKNLSTSIKDAKDRYQKMLQERKEELENIVGLSYDVFKQKVDECVDNTNESSRSNENEFKEYIHSAAELQLVCLRKVIHEGSQLLDEFKSNSPELEEGPTRIEESISASVREQIEEQNKFLALAVKLTEINCKLESQKKLSENFDCSQKLEDLRVQQIMFEEEKKIAEQRIQEENTLLEEKAKILETEKEKLNKKENDLVSREQELLLRRKLMDNYLGVCISRSNKLVVDKPFTPESLFDLMESYESIEKELTLLKSKHADNLSDGSLQSGSQGTCKTPIHSMPNLSNLRRVQFREAINNDSSLQNASFNDCSQLNTGGCRSSMPNINRGDNHEDQFERAFPGGVTPKTVKKSFTQRLTLAVRSTLRGKKSKSSSTKDVNRTDDQELQSNLEKMRLPSENLVPAANARKTKRQVKQTIPKKLAD